MAFDAGLLERIREIILTKTDCVERRMFGGVACMVRGNLTVGIIGDDLMVRVGKENHAANLTKPGARLMDFTGRPMKGFLVIDAEAIAEDEDLGDWIDTALEFNSTLPAK